MVWCTFLVVYGSSLFLYLLNIRALNIPSLSCFLYFVVIPEDVDIGGSPTTCAFASYELLRIQLKSDNMQNKIVGKCQTSVTSCQNTLAQYITYWLGATNACELNNQM